MSPTKPKSANQRKADERARKRAGGLVPIEVWVRAENAQRVRDYAARLDEKAHPR